MFKAAAKMNRQLTPEERAELLMRGRAVWGHLGVLAGTVSGRNGSSASSATARTSPTETLRQLRADAQAIGMTLAEARARVEPPPRQAPDATPHSNGSPFSIVGGSSSQAVDHGEVELSGPVAAVNAYDLRFTLAYDQLLIGGEENASWWLNQLQVGDTVHLLAPGGYATRVLVRREPGEHRFTAIVCPEAPSGLPTLGAER
jgi:hypothetical protein